MKTTALLCVLVVCFSSFALGQAQAPANAPYKDTSLPMERRVDDLVSRMTLEEKVSQLTNGSDAIPRLGDAEIRLVE